MFERHLLVFEVAQNSVFVTMICQGDVSVRFVDLCSLSVHIASYQTFSLCPQGVLDIGLVMNKTTVTQLGMR